MNKNILCCQADDLRRVKMNPVNGNRTRIPKPDEIIAEVKGMHLPSGPQIRNGLLKNGMVYDYIPKASG